MVEILFALANTSGGIVRPICLAIFRLITKSKFMGCELFNFALIHCHPTSPILIWSSYTLLDVGSYQKLHYFA